MFEFLLRILGVDHRRLLLERDLRAARYLAEKHPSPYLDRIITEIKDDLAEYERGGFA